MPEGLTFELAALGTDAGMTSYHAMVTRGEAGPGMKVGVIGLGGLGQIGARVAVVRGAEVHVAEVDEAVWPAAREIGAMSVVGDVLEWADQGFDLIVDYAGYGTTTAGALKAIRKNGRVVVVGMARMQITLDTMDIIHKQAQPLGSSGGTKDDVAAIYALLASGDVSPVVNVIGFDDIPAGLDDLQHHQQASNWWHGSATDGCAVAPVGHPKPAPGLTAATAITSGAAKSGSTGTRLTPTPAETSTCAAATGIHARDRAAMR